MKPIHDGDAYGGRFTPLTRWERHRGTVIICLILLAYILMLAAIYEWVLTR